MVLSLKLLDGFSVCDASGVALSLPTRKTRALLAYLAVHTDKPQPRERLMALLWGDRSEKRARQSLNQALSSIRSLGVPGGLAVLDSDNQWVTLRGDAVTTDVQHFRRLLADDPTEASALYRHPFLDGLAAPDPTFEEWLIDTRSALQMAACDALERSAAAAVAADDVESAIAALRRLVDLDPLREDAHRQLMRLFHRDGNRPAAIRQYRACAKILKRELEIEPDLATKALFDLVKEIGEPHGTEKEPILIADDHVAPNVGPYPNKPCIAVLPFTNLSNDTEHGYFADGLSEDIITALSNMGTYSVQGWSPDFVSTDLSSDARQVKRHRDAQYVIGGSVRYTDDRIRVAVRLIDATTGDLLWSNRYDEMLKDKFDLQDRITTAVVGSIEPKLVRAEGQRLQAKMPYNMSAHDYLRFGLAFMHKVTPSDTKKALACFKRAINLDANYGRAYAFASWCYRRDVQQYGLTYLPEFDRKKAIYFARKALRCDPNDPYVLNYAAGTIRLIEGDFEEALALHDRAIAIHPSSHRFWNAKAQVHSFRGESDEAIVAGERAISICPTEPGIWVGYWSIAEAHLQERRYEEAAAFAKHAIRHNQHLAPGYYVLAAASAHLGDETNAKAALTMALKFNPDMTIRDFPKSYHVSRFKKLEDYFDGLRKAGLS